MGIKINKLFTVSFLSIIISLFCSNSTEVTSKNSMNLPMIFKPFNFYESRVSTDDLINKIEEKGIINYSYSRWHDIGSVRIRIISDIKKNKIKQIIIQPTDFRKECIYCSKKGYASICHQIDYKYNKKLFYKIYLQLKNEIGEYDASSSIIHYDLQAGDPREKNYIWKREGFVVKLSLMKMLNEGCGSAWFIDLSAENNM